MAYNQTISVTNLAYAPVVSEWIGAVRNAFLSCSFVRIPQSGSVDDLTTLGVRTAQRQQITYDVFAFNDALQATTPLFIRIRYFSGGAPGSMCLNAQMGNAHNGSGSLTGTSVTTEIENGSTTAASPVSGANVIASGDGSYLTLINTPQDTRSGQVLLFERLYNANGQPVSGGFHLCGTSGGSTVNDFTSQVSYSGSSPAPRQTNGPVFLKPTANPALYDGRLLLGLIFPYAGFPLNPTPNMLLATSTEVSPYQLLKYTVYGQERTYRNSAISSFAAAANPFTGAQILVRED